MLAEAKHGGVNVAEEERCVAPESAEPEVRTMCSLVDVDSTPGNTSFIAWSTFLGMTHRLMICTPLLYYDDRPKSQKTCTPLTDIN